MVDPLKPDLALLAKLGALVVHVDEALSEDGHEYDWRAVELLLKDPAIIEWIKAMGPMVPLKRKANR